jgi:hypothetical protein
MIRKATIVFLLFACAAIPAAFAAPAPKLVCPDPVFRFGERHGHEDVDHVFLLRNEGERALEITKVQATCGCTVARIGARQIPPGGETTVRARLSLKGRRGVLRKNIVVHSNDPDKPRLDLLFEGTVLRDVELTPPSLVFGRLAADQHAQRELTVHLHTGDRKLKEALSFSPHFSARLETVREGREYRAIVRTVPPLPSGSVDGRVDLVDDRRELVAHFSVRAYTPEALLVAPRTLVLPADSQNPVTRQIILRPGTSGPFEIARVTVPDDAIRASVHPLAGNGKRIQLDNIVPSLDLNEARVVIETSATNRPRVEVPFHVIGSTPR